jgi:hypothetical protein
MPLSVQFGRVRDTFDDLVNSLEDKQSKEFFSRRRQIERLLESAFLAIRKSVGPLDPSVASLLEFHGGTRPTWISRAPAWVEKGRVLREGEEVQSTGMPLPAN